jgi:hypothetical protein
LIKKVDSLMIKYGYEKPDATGLQEIKTLGRVHTKEK